MFCPVHGFLLKLMHSELVSLLRHSETAHEIIEGCLIFTLQSVIQALLDVSCIQMIGPSTTRRVTVRISNRTLPNGPL